MLRISTGRGPRPASGGFETFSWYYFRVSGVGSARAGACAPVYYACQQ